MTARPRIDPRPRRTGTRKARTPGPALPFALALLVVALLPCAAAAQHGWPPFQPDKPPPPFRNEHEPREREPWMRKSIVVGGGMAYAFDPNALSKYFSPRPGIAIIAQDPVFPVVDVRLSFETLDMKFDGQRFRREMGAPLDQPGSASIGAVSLGIAVHPDREGFQPFFSLAAMLPDVSQPGITYTDAASQVRQIDGTDIFGFDPGFTLGGGLAWRRYEWFGAEIEARLWMAPGRTEPAVVLLPVRAAVSIPLPASW